MMTWQWGACQPQCHPGLNAGTASLQFAGMKKSLGAKAVIYPAPVLVVGSYDAANEPNFATASFGGLCCTQPPCIAVSLRQATYSFENILKRFGNDTEISTKGRHDPCVGIRAVPVGEAMMAIVLADHYLRHRGQIGAAE